ncbi:MAG: hypothetical protein AAFY69_13450 [Pseudomonadota bacterium]
MTITTRSLPPAGTQTTRVWRPVLTALGAAVIAACGGGGGGDGGTPPPSAGSPPSVSTTNQIVVSAGDPVSLSASATDPDGDTISFSWRQDSGASVANTTGFDSSSASFTANSEVDTLQFTVTATANGQSDSETVYVIIVEDINTAVFVDKDATGTPDGSIDNPFTELRSTFENAPNDSDFYIRTPASGERYVINGDNDSLQSLGSGQSVYGGYGADWVRDPELNKTPIDSVRVGVYHLNVAAPTVVSGLEIDIQAVEGDSTSGSLFGVLGQGSGAGSYTVADNSIVVDSVTARSSSASSAPVVGVYLTNLPTAAVRDNTMALGDGSPATDRGGRTLDAGRDGVPGEDARVGDNQTGGDPGASSGGGWNGGRGGDAGTTSFEPGDGGGRGSGRTSPVVVSGGSGGTLGSDALGNRNAGDGADGDNGPRGPGGSGGSGRGSTGPNGVYAGALGGLGSDGWAGGGGGGGGGGSAGAAGVNGGAGGGGGEGGDGGSGGFGGAQGGASIGIHLARVTASDISGNDITTGNGATGGRGGAGSEGGSGGSGGLGVAGTNGLGDNDGGRGGDGGAGGSGGSGGFGGSGGGGPAFGIFFGGDSGGTVTGNTITTGNGGTGAAARDSNELASAGEGGWSVGIFDADTADGIAITQSGNTFAIGTPGANGAPSTGTGTAMETNLP